MNHPVQSPFALENEATYQRWRDYKLENHAAQLDDLVVELKQTKSLSASEHAAILERCQKNNMAIYKGNSGDDPDRAIPHYLGRCFGLENLDHNWLGDEDGLTSLTVADEDDATRQHYIPYSNRPIKWHTDGYYNAADKQIQGLLLHCVHPASSGGENALLDQEMAYLLLREKNPEFIQLLMQNDVMTIPPRLNEHDEVVRRAETGPVFSINKKTGNLHMRYTIRTHHIIWKEDPATQAALTALSDILHSDSPLIFRGKLESGMGLISNNILHDRSGFNDADKPHRLIYRARYYDRIAGTNISDLGF